MYVYIISFTIIHIDGEIKIYKHTNEVTIFKALTFKTENFVLINKLLITAINELT